MQHGYSTRKSKNSEPERLQRRSKYHPSKSTMYQLQGTDATGLTTHLPSRPRVGQDTYFPKMNARRMTDSLTPRQEAMLGTDPLLPRMSAINTHTPPVWNGTREGRKNTSLLYYLVRLAKGIWKLIKNIPPRQRFACISLFIAVLIILSSIVNFLLQIIAPLANPIYIILGIIASVTVIYEFVLKD